MAEQHDRAAATRKFRNRRYEMQKQREAEDLKQRWRDDLATEYRMNMFGSNFYGMRQLMPMIETLAYISMEEVWPKPKQ